MAKILIIADQSKTCSATPRGLELAAKLGLDVEVVAFSYTSFKSLRLKPAEQAKMKKRVLKDREQATKALIKKYQVRGQKIALKVLWEKDVERWVCKQCAGGRYAAVVKTGSKSHTVVHSSVDWQLLRECAAPVLLVAQKKWHRAKPVLVTLDLSSTVARKRALNRKVLEAGRDLAAALEVELKIITAIEIPALLSDLDLVDPIAYVRDAREAMKPQIKKLAADFGIPEKAFYCKRGPVEQVIASQAAKVRAQIVVMGTVARTGVRARLLGNTAERVLRFMKTDVLAIKP
ncbi:MAG: universal stress protein E [Halioglobus sp.]|jgi:universal stress protein E